MNLSDEVLASPEAAQKSHQRRQKWLKDNRAMIEQSFRTRLSQSPQSFPPGASLIRTSFFARPTEQWSGVPIFWNPGGIAHVHGAFKYVVSTPRTVAALHAMPLDNWPAALAYLLANYDKRIPVGPVRFGGRYTAAHAPPDGTPLPTDIRLWVRYEIHDWRKHAGFNRDQDMEPRLLFCAQNYDVKEIIDDEKVVLYREQRTRNACSTCSI